MSEPAGLAPLEQRAEPETAVAPSAGTTLRAAREAAGLHIGALAVALKVPVKKLEALESDRFDLLPDAVFARALASSVCRTLKIDAAAVLQLLPQSLPAPLKADERGINAPFSSSGDRARASMIEQLSRPVVLTALALCVAALVLVFFPTKDPSQGTTVSALAGAQAPALAQAASAPAPVAQVAPDVVPAARLEEPVAAAGPASGADVTVPGPNVLPAPANPALALAAGANGAPAQILFVSTRGDSWIEVTDGARVVQVSRIMRSGESAQVSGTLPLAVSIGRVDVTEIQVRGKPLDLRPWTKDNVARFEVK